MASAPSWRIAVLLNSASPQGQTILVCTPFGRDADNIAKLLGGAGRMPRVVADLNGVAAALDAETGAVLLTDEAMRMNIAALQAAVAAQPSWSDVPFVVLVPRQKTASPHSEFASYRLAQITTNMIVLERPLSAQSLLSAVETVLRSRARQFVVRDHMQALETAAGELRRNAELLEARVAERTTELQHEMQSREHAEEALRQAQKMEAIGQLTGGIAHDFNNIIQGISGAVNLIQRRMAAGRTDGIADFLEAAGESAKRAATLTQRLLAFSRRQSLETKPVDVTKMVKSLGGLLRRTVTEKIVLREDLQADCNALTDVNQLENALLNLVINSRDAMPDGGVITISTSDVDNADDALRGKPPGSEAEAFLRIDVADTGVGMEKAVIEKAFDPFFTTKPLGAGTGLGLSMVYGFARQSGGWVSIDSAPESGTTVSIFLPATLARAAHVPGEALPALEKGDGQHVLIVDDEAHVRMIVREVLTDMGYQSADVGDPYAAMSMLTSTARIDLLITDVGMPGMNGRELAESARRLRPDLPILFITGYAENAAIRESFLGTNMAMVTKPFALDALSAKIVEMLAQGESARASSV